MPFQIVFQTVFCRYTVSSLSCNCIISCILCHVTLWNRCFKYQVFPNPYTYTYAVFVERADKLKLSFWIISIVSPPLGVHYRLPNSHLVISCGSHQAIQAYPRIVYYVIRFPESFRFGLMLFFSVHIVGKQFLNITNIFTARLIGERERNPEEKLITEE